MAARPSQHFDTHAPPSKTWTEDLHVGLNVGASERWSAVSAMAVLHVSVQVCVCVVCAVFKTVLAVVAIGHCGLWAVGCVLCAVCCALCGVCCSCVL